MQQQRKILFKKWQDPLAIAENSSRLEEDEDDEKTYHDSYDDLDKSIRNAVKENTNQNYERQKVGRVVTGPNGIIPVNEGNIPSRLFNFWMGHTNFYITKPISETIESIHGIEILQVFTPYRFRFAVGMAFDEDEVQENIVKALCQPKESIKAEIVVSKKETLKKYLDNKYKFWFMVMSDKQEILHTFGNDDEKIFKDELKKTTIQNGDELIIQGSQYEVT